MRISGIRFKVSGRRFEVGESHDASIGFTLHWSRHERDRNELHVVEAGLRNSRILSKEAETSWTMRPSDATQKPNGGALFRGHVSYTLTAESIRRLRVIAKPGSGRVFSDDDDAAFNEHLGVVLTAKYAEADGLLLRRRSRMVRFRIRGEGEHAEDPRDVHCIDLDRLETSFPRELVRTIAAQIEAYGDTVREQAIAAASAEIAALREELGQHGELERRTPVVGSWLLDGRSSSEDEVEDALATRLPTWRYAGYLSPDPVVRANWARAMLDGLHGAELQISESPSSITIFWRTSEEP